MLKAWFLGLACFGPGMSAAQSTQNTGPAHILGLENGWYGEGLSITLDVSTQGCPFPPNQYFIKSDHPSYKQMVAAAYIAFVQKAPITMIIQPGTCSVARTNILSIVSY